ncbi:MAG: hypothetical protein AB1765_04445 [Candidatus Hydrogenedentota bacterium]
MSQIQRALQKLQKIKEKKESTLPEQPVILPIIHPGQKVVIEEGYDIYTWKNNEFINKSEDKTIGLDILSSKRKLLDIISEKDSIFLLSEIFNDAAPFFVYFRNILFITETKSLSNLGKFIAMVNFFRIRAMMNVLTDESDLIGKTFDTEIKNRIELLKDKNSKYKEIVEKIDNTIKWLTHNIFIPSIEGIELLTALRDLRKGYAEYFDDNATIFNNVKDIYTEVSNPKYLFTNNYFSPTLIY